MPSVKKSNIRKILISRLAGGEIKKIGLKEGNHAKHKKLWEQRGLEKEQFSTLDGVQNNQAEFLTRVAKSSGRKFREPVENK